MTQKPRNENACVVCLFCGSRTFVPFSATRDITDNDSGIALVRCHVCGKEAPYSASEVFLNQEVSIAEGNPRSRAAGI
jgi:transcription elongation factor Elf1